MASRLDEIFESGMYLRVVTKPVMTGEEHNLFWRFTKMKPPIFCGIESEDAYEFIINCHKRVHKMGAVERYGIEFITFQLMGDTKL